MYDLPDYSALLKPMTIDTPIQHMWSDEQFELLKKHIRKFESSLDENHEVGVMLTNFGQSVLMNVHSITYEYPVLLIFNGYVNGQRATLVQHINQLNFMLMALQKTGESQKQPIGFVYNGQG